MSHYVPRPAIDAALAEGIGRGAGVFTLEGPPGAGKSAALLHALEAEIERRRASGGGRGYVRLVQLWGDEPPSLFARRLVREAGHLHLASYPQPEHLKLLIETMAEAVPGLSAAGKLLGALVPDDLRPLHEVATAALQEVGARAAQRIGPLVIGVDLLGGTVSTAAQEFFERLAAALPPTVVLIVAQPGGAQRLLPAPSGGLIPVGALTPIEAHAYLREGLGPLGEIDEALVSSGRLSLLPGDLAQLVQYHRAIAAQRRADTSSVLTAVAELLSRDVAARYQALYESACAREEDEAQAAAELCAWVAVAARPERPLDAADALQRLGGDRDGAGHLQPAGLWRLRQHELVRALCATALPAGAGPADLDAGWPLAPRHGHAQRGVLQSLERGGVLPVYERRWLGELWPPGGGKAGLGGGVQAVLVLLEQARRPGAGLGPLGAALALLEELEVQLWHAGWHRTFAELYDALLPLLSGSGVTPRDAAPALWFRRARARVQAVDWSPPRPDAPVPGERAEAAHELRRAIADLAELDTVSESAVLGARGALGLAAHGAAVATLCRRLPRKAAQARGYARVLALLLAEGGDRAALEAERRRGLDEILQSLAFFVAGGAAESEAAAQSLTILADWYSSGEGPEADELARDCYAQAVRTAESVAEPPGPPAFSLGVIHRSWARHERRRGRPEAALRAEAEARRWLLRDPDTRMGSLLANLM